MQNALDPHRICFLKNNLVFLLRMKKELNKKQVNAIKDGVEWTMRINLSMTIHDEDMDEFTDGCLYTDGEYGYYERTHTICSDNYETLFRFDKGKMKDVLLFLAENPPYDLEHYLMTLEGCEIVEQERL